MIPKRFIRIWLDEPVPAKFEAFWEHAKALHPTWDFVTLDDSSQLGWMRCKDVFDAQTTHAGRADVLRYAAVFEMGGTYVDADLEFLRPLDDLLDGPPFAGWENRQLICPTVIGAEAGHPAMKVLLDMLPRWAAARRGKPPNLQTGPHFLTAQWRRRRDVRLLPREAFYPVGWWERDKLGGPYPPESYAVHHWAQGWDPEAKARIDAAQPTREA